VNHRFAKVVDQDVDQRKQLGQLAQEAIVHWAEIPVHQRNLDQAKEWFMRWSGAVWDK
jgi:hypothetical protein